MAWTPAASASESISGGSRRCGRVLGVGVEDGAVVVEGGKWRERSGLVDPDHVLMSGFDGPVPSARWGNTWV